MLRELTVTTVLMTNWLMRPPLVIIIAPYLVFHKNSFQTQTVFNDRTNWYPRWSVNAGFTAAFSMQTELRILALLKHHLDQHHPA